MGTLEIFKFQAFFVYASPVFTVCRRVHKKLVMSYQTYYNYFNKKFIMFFIERKVAGMEITDVRVRKISDDGKMKAVVSVTFDDEFVVHDIKIIDGQSGLFIAMPSRKLGEGDFRDIAHPLTSATRNRIKDAIFEAYDKLIQGMTPVIGQPESPSAEGFEPDSANSFVHDGPDGPDTSY